jgi:hypothetical protein
MVLSSTIILSLIFALPQWYSLLEKKKTPTKFLIPTQQGNLPYHVTKDSPILSSLFKSKHYNFLYFLCLYGMITIV